MTEALPRRKFAWLCLAIFLLALLLREQFILMTQVEAPIRGDIRQYVAYAHNLADFGVFSSVENPQAAPAPDSFRGPGFPLLLSGLVRATGTHWYEAALHVQALLGALTVLLGMALGRHWLSRPATLAAGLLMAVWPHHVAATGALLSEVVFGFVVMLATWATARAARGGGQAWAWLAGSAFAYAYLVNPVILLFPALAGLVLWRPHRSLAITLVLVPALVAVAWGARDARLPPNPAPGRATINLVQGSWPMMHAAHAFRFREPQAAAILAQIGAEEQLLASDPAEGLRTMAARMGQEPLAYLRWYAWEKPYLLWEWDIRIGHGDVYFLEVEHSPLDRNPMLRGLKSMLRWLNPMIFLLSAAAALSLPLLYWRRRDEHPALVLVALLCVYLTAVHVVFQAEPRYAIPYRPFQMLMLASALAFAGAWVSRRRRIRG
jgi:hypothetical protein